MDGGRPQLQRRQPEQSVLHRAVREGWPGVLAAAEEQGGFPKRVHEEVRRFLGCGDVRRGFTLAKCEACKESTLIAFSCKSRGWCPCCGARRAHEAEAHLMEVLPKVGFRQWTLSLPFALRWPVVKKPKLLRALERCLTRAIFRSQRAQVKRLGQAGKAQGGAVCFVQWFSSTLALQPHLHLLVPEGVWCGGVFLELPRPTPEELEAVLARMLAQAKRTFEALDAAWPEDGFEALQLQGAQERLNLNDESTFGGHRDRLVAVGEGFSLHAGTSVHGNDRDSLARLCRYGARGPIASSRLSRRDDGKYAYETKKGVTLVLTAEHLVRRLLWLIPPARFHLTSFHGVLSSHAAARATLLPTSASHPPRPTAPAAAAATGARAVKPKTPRLDWASLHAKAWAVDVWQCPCGGRRKVTAIVTSRSVAEEILRNLRLLPPSSPRFVALAQAPPQLELLPHSH
jgi:hypothetical protein